MKVEFEGISLNYEVLKKGGEDSFYIFFLHGFTGSSTDWNEIIENLPSGFNYTAIDLLGHGKSDSPEEVEHYTSEKIIYQLHHIIKNITRKKVILVGYSMGGRTALNYAIQHQDNLNGLILESATPGIEDNLVREERIKKDEELAQLIFNNPIEKFVEYWMNLEIFNTQRRFSDRKLEEIKKKKWMNKRIGLANSLIGFGTGSMSSLWKEISTLKIPVLLISGELDTKFIDINKRMSELIPNSELINVKNAGHNVHLEEPNVFCHLLKSFFHQLSVD